MALLPTIAMCGIAYVGARDEILMAEERSSLRMAQYLRSELSSLLSSYPAKLNTIASDMAVIRLIRSYRKADAVEAKSLQYALMSRLISEAASLRGFMSVEIVTDTGTPISKLPYSIMNESLFARIEGANEKFVILFLHLIPYKILPRQQITVMITQVIPVNGVIFKQASSHCTYPHTATASTLENIQPLSSKPLNIRDVTGINTRPSRHIISHQIRNVKKSEPRSQ